MGCTWPFWVLLTWERKLSSLTPSFDLYRSQVQLTGGKRVEVPLILRKNVRFLIFSNQKRNLFKKLLRLLLIVEINERSISASFKKVSMNVLRQSSLATLTIRQENFSAMLSPPNWQKSFKNSQKLWSSKTMFTKERLLMIC